MGKKKKTMHTRNITGLRNQCPAAPDPPPAASHPVDLESDSDSEDEWEAHLHGDSLKTDWKGEAQADSDTEDTPGNEAGLVEDDEDLCWNDGPLDSKNGLFVKMMQFAVNEDDDPRDENWMPAKLQSKALKEKARSTRVGMKYKGGRNPDVGSKAPRTRRRYKSLLRDQTSLTRLDPAIPGLLVESFETSDPPIRHESLTPPRLEFMDKDSQLGAYFASGVAEATPPPFSAAPSTINSPQAVSDGTESDGDPQQKRRASVSVSELEFSSRAPEADEDLVHGDAGLEGGGNDDGMDASALEEHAREELDDWEEELGEITNPVGVVRGWFQLRDLVKAKLLTESKTLPVSQVNCLMIIRNFSTLHLKGYRWMEASNLIADQWDESKGASLHFACRIRALVRHYQVYEQLPIEARGGFKNCRSLLKDEAIQAAARTWLTSQPVGQVTLEKFCNGLNSEILLSLGLSTSTPLCKRTAHRWLIKLGWIRTRIKKGVYMDGHERPNVVKYRNEVFLPMMEKYQSRMARYEGPELVWIEPELQPGEREIIAEFQDESCFHVNEHQGSAWLHHDQQILVKKSRGRLIHVSDFVEEPNGRLIVWDEAGRDICDPVFEESHPGCQALFVFDQSTAHAALSPDALKAFEMNKSNGGKQRFQKDTVIPQSNPFPKFQGKPQQMTVPGPNGTRIQKGLEQALREHGFNVSSIPRAKCKPVCPFENDGCCMARILSKQEDFVNQTLMVEKVITDAGHLCIFLPKFHCELNPIEMYWGWVKYRYWQLPKATFEDAKQAAARCLDACPTDVIRWFVNRSWRFLDAYRKGLTGKAAAWAVRRYRGHRTISDTALGHLEASGGSAPA